MRKILLASALGAVISSPVWAQPATGPVRDNNFSYTYGQLAYDRWDWDRGLEANVLTGEGSYALDEHLYLRGGLSLYRGDIRVAGARPDVRGERLYGGLGFHTPLQDGLDLEASFDLIYDDMRIQRARNRDDFGFELRGGVRHATTDKLELSGGLSYMDVYNSDLGLYGQGLLKISPEVDLGARLVVASDRDSLGLFARYNF